MSPDICNATPTTGLVASLLATTDCQTSSLVERGYSALSSPGAATAAMLTSLMVIAVALYGYRLLLGRGLALGDVIGLAIRLGVVVLLAATWSSFQALAYDTVAREPSQIANNLIVSIEAPPPLSGVQSALDQIDELNVGWRTRAGIASPLVGGAPTAAMALNVSSFLLMISTLGLLVVSRVLLSLLLAITPLVAGFLLFDATRGLLEGWLRALTTAALLPLFVLILSAIELSILAPLLDQMAGQQARGQFELNDVTPVGLVVLIFSLAAFASVRVAATIAGGIRLPKSAWPFGDRISSQSTSAAAGVLLLPDMTTTTVASPVVRALEAAARRDGTANEMRATIAALGGERDRSSRGGETGRRSGNEVIFSPAKNTNPAPGHTRLVRASRSAARRDS